MLFTSNMLDLFDLTVIPAAAPVSKESSSSRETSIQVMALITTGRTFCSKEYKISICQREIEFPKNTPRVTEVPENLIDKPLHKQRNGYDKTSCCFIILSMIGFNGD